MKRLEGVVLLGIITIVGVLGISGSSSALEYQTNPSSGDNPVTLKFEFGSTLTINTDGNIAISNLTPGTANVSNSSYRVTVNTNNVAGYTLTATVGCSSGTDCYNNKTLSDGTNTFSMVTSTSGTALAAGEWGFATSGSATATSNVFKTLALYSDTTPTTLNKTKNATGTAYDSTYIGNNTTPFQIGAYAANNQVAGTYTNSINFSAVANPVPEYTVTLSTSNADTIIIDGVSYANGDTPSLTQGLHHIFGTISTGNIFGSWSSTGGVSITNSSSLSTTITITDNGTLSLKRKIYMQDMTLADCQKNVVNNIGENITVYDKRDGKDYTVKYINGQCWMTQNLRTIGVIYSADSNFSSVPSFNISEYELGDEEHCTGVYIGSSPGYSNVCSHYNNDEDKGAWYNYAAATAGQVIVGSAYVDSTEDICPINWHLPSSPGTIANTDINIMAGIDEAVVRTPTDSLIAFDPIGSGHFGNGVYLGGDADRGYWWTSNSYDNNKTYVLFYNSTTGVFNIGGYDTRAYGNSVRCVKTE